jgi:hypothetical protein
MADLKKEGKGLTGRHVEVFLTTPLFRFRYTHGNHEKELLENAVRVSGTITGESVGGITMEVNVLSNMKQKETELPFEEIFLPFSKIDFIVVE